MKLEVGRSIKGAAEFTGRTIKAHKEGIIFTASALLMTGATTAGWVAIKNANSNLSRIDTELQLRYPGLPSQKKFDEATQNIAAFDRDVIQAINNELGNGNTVIDLKKIGDTQAAQENIIFTKTNQDLLSERETLRQRMIADKKNMLGTSFWTSFALLNLGAGTLFVGAVVHERKIDQFSSKRSQPSASA